MWKFEIFFYIYLHLKDDLGTEFTASLLMMPEGVLISFTVCEATMWVWQSRTSTEYLIPTDNIIVFDLHFNFTNKSNLVGRL